MGSTTQSRAASAADLEPFTIAEPGAPPGRVRWIWHALNLSPFFLLLWFVSRFGVNVPQVDEWFLAYLFHAVRFKAVTLGNFFALANEHRIAFPRAVWMPLAFATHWNLRVEMMVNLIAALVIFAVFYKLALQQTQHIGTAMSKLANFATSLLVFSLVQYGVWLCGLAGGFLFAQAWAALAIGVCFLGRLNPWARLALAALCCFGASFSMAWGLASWLALLPCIAVLQAGKGNTAKFVAWFLVFAATMGLYFYHFRFLEAAGSSLGFVSHLAHSAGFFVMVLGSPFCQSGAAISIPLAFVTGAVVLVALTACLFMLRGYEREITAPWLATALFGLFFAAMVTVGRGNWGYEAAVQSRYATGTIFIAIAALQLGRLACVHKGRQIYLLLVGGLGALLIAGSIAAISAAHYLKEDLSHAKLFIEVLRYIDPATDSASESVLFPLYPTEGTGNIRPTAELLNQIGFMRLASDVAFVDQPSSEYGSFEIADGSGDLMHLRRRKDQITISGWASLSGSRGLPKLVMISYSEQKTFITGAAVGRVNRPDIAALRRDPRYVHSGWKVTFPAKFLPIGSGILKAWVYDAAEKKFVRLPDSGVEKQFKIETP